MKKNNKIAFFDVDGTVYTGVTMFDFLKYYTDLIGRKDEYLMVTERIGQLKSAGKPRHVTAMEYYKYFFGHDKEKIMIAGEKWFRSRGIKLINKQILKIIEILNESNFQIVLVSGSFDACLGPIGNYISASSTLSSELGYFNNKINHINQLMLGENKKIACEKIIRELSPECVIGAGDHSSDINFMDLANHQIIVGEDRLLLQHATLHWNSYTHVR